MNEYEPNTVTSTGETLREWMIADLARRLGWPFDLLNDVLDGRERLPKFWPEVLEKVTGIPAGFWMNRDRNYWEAKRTNETGPAA